MKTCWPEDNNPILQAQSALSGAEFIPVPSSQVLMNNRSPERRGQRSCGGLSEVLGLNFQNGLGGHDNAPKLLDMISPLPNSH